MLGLSLNAVYHEVHRRRVDRLPAEGHEIRDEGIACLPLLKRRNLNLLGRYSFTASLPDAGALRPLRAPDAPELDEDDAEDAQK